MNRRSVRRAAFVLYAIAWTVVLVVPDPLRWLPLPFLTPDGVPRAPAHADKLVHFAGYFALAMLGAASFGGKPAGVASHWILLGCAAHAAMTEAVQHWVPDRAADVTDWLADLAGVIAGLAAAAGWARLRRTMRSGSVGDQ